jgi:hypothetical protein
LDRKNRERRFLKYFRHFTGKPKPSGRSDVSVRIQLSTFMLRHFVLLPLLVATVHADPLKQTDREALLDRLDKLSDAADAKVDARFKVAVTAFRAAMASDTATMELYLKCVEKVEYSDNYKKSQDFREWKRKESATLESVGFREALRHQLGWLLLTLEAASTHGKPAGLDARMETAVDEIFTDIDKLKDGRDVLTKSVTESVFAKAYDIKDLKLDDWPMSPVDLTSIFSRNLIPRYRTVSKIPELRAEWTKWIKYEGLMIEKWPQKEERRDGKELTHNPSADYDKWMAEKYPQMLWDEEVDVFKAGDQTGASAKMLAHIEKYMSSTKAPAWTKQFRNLVSGKGSVDDKALTPAAARQPAATPDSAAAPDAAATDKP